MADKPKTKAQLLGELTELRKQVASIKRSRARARTAEEALVRSERRFRELADALPETIYETDAEGRLTFVNGTGLDSFGYTIEEVTSGLNPLDVFVPEDRERVAEGLKATLQGQPKTPTEYTALRKDGSTFPVVVHAAPVMQDGICVGSRGMVIDITHQVQAERVLRESQAKYQQLYDCAPSPYHTLTPEGRLTNVNRKWCEALGYEKGVVLGKSIFDFIIEEERDDARASFDKKKQSRQPFTRGNERHYRTKTGGHRTFVTSDYFLFDQEGNIVAVQTTFDDITERKKIEQDLRDANMRLSAALAELKRTQLRVIEHERLSAIGQMASGIAHNFNNALMPILGFSDLLIQNPEMLANTEDAVRMLTDIRTAAEDAAEAVRRLRDFYRPPDTDEHTSLDLNAIVETALALTRPRWKEEAAARDIAFEIRKELHSLPVVMGNESQLREVVANLILNALDAMTDGGVLTLRSSADDVWAVLEVIDTGTGMSPDVKRQCFEPFFSTKESTGTGMGLSIAHGIVRQHGGAISIQTEPGEGTRFVIRIPHGPPEQDAEGKTVRKTPKVRPLKVLAIDDEIWSRELLQRLLQADGHTLELATTGGEGVKKFFEGEYDLVMTDRAMPDMSGDKVAAEIKSKSPSTPILMLTGFGDIMRSSGEYPEGVDDIIGKPITKDELRQVIAATMAAVDQDNLK